MSLTFLEWEDRYSVGFRLIDEQHKRLFIIYNKIVKLKQDDQPDSPKRQEVLEQLAKELSDYVWVHFLTEEEVMKIYGYDDFEAHKKLHDQFGKSIQEMCSDFSKGQLILMDAVIKKIHNWLVHHVTSEDQKYKGFIK